jgi:acetolactate synthase-1/3 small subunit|tara:strand:- start:213 stop:716 length:504 start_codon:yes stop_codon:yes gene_type:complete
MILNTNQSHRIVTALVEDKPGVLARISGMFRRRGFNIKSLVVGQCELPNKSRMTFVVEGNDKTVEQVTNHLYKLVEVIKVNDISDQNLVERELALIRVKTNAQTRSEIMQIVDIFRAHIVDVANDATIVEVTGNELKVNSLQKLLEPFGILEVMRTGTIATSRGLQK